MVLAILSLYFLPIIFFYCVNALHGVNLFNACSIFVMRITLQNMSQGQKSSKFPCGLTIKALVKIRN